MTGYESKRAAAHDKLDHDDALTIAYQSGFYDGKKAAQPAQEPVAREQLLHLVDAYVEASAKCDHILEHYAQTEFQIAQAKADLAKARTTFKSSIVALLFAAPPQRPWVGLTDEEIGEIHSAAEGQSVGVATGLTERKLKEKNNAA